MKPPFDVSSKIVILCSEITRLLGQYEGFHISKPEPKLRRSNQVRTIQASLAIEGNTLALEQVTAILEGKRVIGSQKEIIEVKNAIKVYEQLDVFKPFSQASFKQAHKLLMNGLIVDAGQWRSKNVGVFQGDKVAHAAPQAKQVPRLMEELFSFIKKEKETHPLILSALFHYETEFIHPFSDGNGRMGRFWQTVLLTQFHPLFQFIPVETVVRERQAEYYQALGLADKEGKSTAFIEFSLSTIFEAFESLKIAIRPEPLTTESRLEIARNSFAKKYFTRKEYLSLFKTISTATASRDLSFATVQKLVEKKGDKSLAKYRFR
jgi:Fic family protein